MAKDIVQTSGAAVIASLVRALSNDLRKVNEKISDLTDKRDVLEVS